MALLAVRPAVYDFLGSPGDTLNDSITISAGSSIVALCKWSNDGSTMSVVDGSGQRFIEATPRIQIAAGEDYQQMFVLGPLPSGTYSVTMTISSPALYVVFQLSEVEGMLAAASQGNAQTSPGTGANALVSDALRTRVTDCTLVAYYANHSQWDSGSDIYSAGTSWTKANGAWHGFTESRNVTSIGDYSSTGTQSDNQRATSAILAFCKETSFTSGLSAPSVTFPLTPHASGRYMVDAGGNPVKLKIRTLWGLPRHSEDSWDIVLNQTVSMGFNAILIQTPQLKATEYPDSPFDVEGELPFEDRLDAAPYTGGLAPFGTPSTEAPDLNTANTVFFDRIKPLISKCEARKITVIWFPMFLSSSGSAFEEIMEANGATKCGQFGTFIGTEFAAYANILWGIGGDYTPGSGLYAEMHAFIDALQAVTKASNQYLGHWTPPETATGVAEFASDMTLNPSYSYDTPAGEARVAYGDADGPTFNIETYYEGNPWGGATDDRDNLRWHIWVSLINSVAGATYGNWQCYPFNWDFFTHMDTPLARDMEVLNTIYDDLDGYWHLSVPSGLGSMITLVTTNRGTIDTDDANEAMQTSDGRRFVLHSGPTAGDPTLNLSTMAANGTYQWLDPGDGSVESSGSFTAASGQAFTRPGGSNSAGSTDWALVLAAANSSLLKKMRRYL